jgi:hypothetical protein
MTRNILSNVFPNKPLGNPNEITLKVRLSSIKQVNTYQLFEVIPIIYQKNSITEIEL